MQYNGKKTFNRTPFILTYNPSLPSISSIIHKHFNLLQSSNRCKNTFKEPPVDAYQRCPNLRDLLIKAQLPPNRNNSHNSTPGSFRCGRPQCLTCSYILGGIKQYTFFSTGETRLIKSHLDCNTNNLIYMIQCNRCHYIYNILEKLNAPSKTDLMSIDAQWITLIENLLLPPLLKSFC